MPLLPRLPPHRPPPSDPAAAPKPALRRAMAGFAAEKLKLVARLRTVRWVTFFLGALNLAAVALAGQLMAAAFPSCGAARVLPFAVLGVVSGIRVMAMVGAGIAQEATATTILRQPGEGSVVDEVVRVERRLKYKRWLWWTRFGMFITVLQFLAACYVMFATVKYLSYGGASRQCYLGQDEDGNKWKKVSMALCLFLAWVVLIVQCLTGNDVLRWRSFYATRDNAWKAHYSEVFDHGLREALCCLGRAKYMSVLEEDEVYSVARLLGDLVAYRASGTGHLELLAGLALLQRHKQLKGSAAELTEAPLSRVQEAVLVHPFAEAAYTGPLLDLGRNPVLFPCVWLHRQGVLTPWMRSRRPVLEGDNWWRGHAAAFVKYAKLHSETLRRGRVKQAKREAAYFIVVLHELKSVVIAVRGTETPEDLITDGLCSECTLSEDDLYGLLNSEQLASREKRRMTMSFPHYGHSGIVEAARELFMQVDGEPGRGDSPSSTSGFLSSLLGEGKECHGYKIRIVGHSLGGAIATFLGIRLYARYPNLHVFSYGTLPCMDSVIAEACSGFVTSIVYNDEFSARLSINSIMRLRASAIAALSQDASADSAMICKLARRVLLLNKYSEDNDQNQQIREGDHQRRRNRYKYRIKGGAFLCAHAVSCMVNMPNHHTSHIRGGCCKKSSNILGVSCNEEPTLFSAGVHEFGQKPLPPEAAPFTEGAGPDNLEEGYDECDIESQTYTGSDVVSIRESVSQLMDESPLPVEGSSKDHQEMYLPGLVIHIVPEQKDQLPLWKSWKIFDKNRSYRAYIANRESFKDIIVSPYTFLDHLPWRCHYAMQRVLETRNELDKLNQDLINV